MPDLPAPSAVLPAMALQGLRVIEMGQLIAGPFAAKMLGEFGAEVIKIEPPCLGEDSDAVLRELGLTDQQVAALRAKGVIA